MRKTAHPVFVAALLMIMPALIKPVHAACTAPVGTAGEIIYNVDGAVFQYCNDTVWVGMHVPGSGTGGCANPAFDEGRLVYSSEHRMLQGCAGAQWKAIGKPPATDWAAAPMQPYTFSGTAGSQLFGRMVAIEGNLAAVTSSGSMVGGFANAGYVNVYNTNTGALVSTFNNPAPATADRMGRNAVDMSGNLGVISAADDDPGGVSGAGSAYVFDVTDGTLVATLNNPSPAIDDLFGFGVGVSGNLAVVGAWWKDPGAVSNAGEAYVFNATTGALIATLVNPDPTADDQFGISVGISGNLAIVGANQHDLAGPVFNAGAAYVFNATTGALLTTINNPYPVGAGYFGGTVAIDGETAIIGAWGNTSGGVVDSGEAYAFNATTGALISTFANPDPTADDDFSRGQVDFSDGIALIGSHQDDPGGIAEAGTAYLFDVASGVLIQTLPNPSPTATDTFGHGVGLSGGTAIVSAYQDDPGGVGGAGSAYVFKAGLPTEGPCTAPAGDPGSIVYTSQHNVLEYCDGARWSAVGLYPYNCDGTQAVGAVCKGGTVYAGLSPDGNLPMFTTQTDAGQLPWNNGTGTYTTTNIVDPDAGEANTAALAALAAGDFPYQAANLCNDSTANGYSDWYLPAANELAVLYANRAAIGGFVANQYWSSTEAANHAATIYIFDGTGSQAATKNGFLYIRCVRK